MKILKGMGNNQFVRGVKKYEKMDCNADSNVEHFSFSE